MSRCLASLPVLSLLSLGASAHAAIFATELQSVPFYGLVGDVYHSYPDETSYGYKEVALYGFSQFDPSLGTLVEIRFGIELEGTLTVYFDAYAWGEDAPADGGTFDAAFFPGSSVLEAGMIYEPSDQDFGRTATSTGFDLPVLGVTDALVDDYIRTDEGRYLAYNDEAMDPLGPIAPTGALPTNDPDVNEADFVGTGNVTTLVAFIYFEIWRDDFVINNIPDYAPSMYAEADLLSGTATLQYIYDDGLTLVPEPGTFGLFLGLGSLAALIGRRRR